MMCLRHSHTGRWILGWLGEASRKAATAFSGTVTTPRSFDTFVLQLTTSRCPHTPAHSWMLNPRYTHLRLGTQINFHCPLTPAAMKLPTLSGSEVALRVDGQDIQEFEDTDGEEPSYGTNDTVVTRSIEATSGVNFSVGFRTTRDFTWRHSQLELFVELGWGLGNGENLPFASRPGRTCGVTYLWKLL